MPGALGEQHIRTFHAFPGVRHMLLPSHSCIFIEAIRKSDILRRFSAELHSRSVDETFWTTEYEEIIDQSCDKAAATRTNDGSPDPIVVTKCEHCKLDQNLR